MDISSTFAFSAIISQYNTNEHKNKKQTLQKRKFMLFSIYIY